MNTAYLNHTFGKKIKIIDAIQHLKEHPKAKFFSRINGTEMIIVGQKFVHKTTDIAIVLPAEKPKTPEPKKVEPKKPVPKKVIPKKKTVPKKTVPKPKPVLNPKTE